MQRRARQALRARQGEAAGPRSREFTGHLECEEAEPGQLLDHIPKVDVLLLQELNAKGSSMRTVARWTIFHARSRKNGVAAVAIPAADIHKGLWMEAAGNHI